MVSFIGGLIGLAIAHGLVAMLRTLPATFANMTKLVWCSMNSHQKSPAFWRMAALITLAIPPGIAAVFVVPDTRIHGDSLSHVFMGHHTIRTEVRRDMLCAGRCFRLRQQLDFSGVWCVARFDRPGAEVH
jgi:hypothetical protein